MHRIFLLLFAAITTAAAAPAGQSKSAGQVSRAAWDALNAGRVQEAAAAFDEAMALAPQQPSLLLGAAVAAHLQAREDDARRLLVDALRIDPTLTSASLLLGAVLYQTGDVEGAIDVYQQALAHAPDQPQLLQRLEAWRKEAALHSAFGRRLGDHFTVLFEGPAEAEAAERAVAILEKAYWRIGTALGIYPAEVVTVVLYTREQFRDITQSPTWAGGAFDGRIRVPVQGALRNPVEFARVLSHELTHAFVRSLAARGVPFWLDEGLAVTLEGSDSSERQARVRAAQAVIPLAALEGSFAALSSADATLAYAESGVAVQALLDTAGASAVTGLLADIGRGLPFADAFERNILVPYGEFKKRWDPGPATKDSGSETRDPGSGIRDPKTGNWKLETGSGKLEAGS